MPVVDGDIVPDIPLARIAEGSATGMPLLIGTTRDEFRLFLVPTGVAGALTPDVLPVLAARYGWPATGRRRRMPRTARRRPRATLPAPSSPTRPSGSRPPAWPPRTTQPGAPSISTSSGGQHPWAVSGPATRSNSCSSSTRSREQGHSWSERAPRSSSPTRCTGPGSAFGRDGDPGWRPWTPERAGRDDLRCSLNTRRRASRGRTRPLGLTPPPDPSEGGRPVGSKLWPSIRA